MRKTNHKCIFIKNGFTILEMSVVLAIIALIAGTILTFSAINSNSKLIAMIKELYNYKTAFNNFTAIYGNLPGDMDNATGVFGNPDVNSNTINNGNGDGLIGDGNYEPQQSQEVASAFQELGLAGLIPNQYPGSINLLGSCIDNSNNAFPYSIYGNSSIYWIYSGNISHNYTQFNSLILSGTTRSCYNDSRILANDAYNIDKKIDDGIPLTGMIIAYNPFSGNAICSDKNMNNLILNHVSSKYITNSSVRNNYCTMHMSLESYGFL